MTQPKDAERGLCENCDDFHPLGSICPRVKTSPKDAETLMNEFRIYRMEYLGEIWLRTALASYALHLAGKLPEKDTEEYDNMVCSNCESFIRKRTWHTDHDGFSECCGKKLKRVQGKKDPYTEKNEVIDACRTAILKEAGIEPKE